MKRITVNVPDHVASWLKSMNKPISASVRALLEDVSPLQDRFVVQIDENQEEYRLRVSKELRRRLSEENFPERVRTLKEAFPQVPTLILLKTLRVLFATEKRSNKRGLPKKKLIREFQEFDE